MNEARDSGLISARSAGSHSPVDVWVFDPKNKLVKLIQVKTKKNARKLIMKDKKVYENITVISSTWSWE